jgi:type I restriction enzyme, S subunit
VRLVSLEPDTWTELALGSIADIDIGRTPSRKDPTYWTTDLTRPFCSIADMDGVLGVRPVREGVTEKAEREKKAKRVPAGALLMSFKLTIGRTGIAEVDLFPNEAIAWIQPYEDSVLRDYLRLYLPTIDFDQHIGVAVKGKTLNKDSLKALPVVVPPLSEQRRMVDLVGAIDNAVIAARDQVAGLVAARTSVISALVAGHEIPDSYDGFLDDTVFFRQPAAV